MDAKWWRMLGPHVSAEVALKANLILVGTFPSFLAVQGLGMKSCISQFDGQNFFLP
jgi:hypothetical protein